MRLRLFGPVTVVRPDGEVDAGPRAQKKLLALLALRTGYAVPTDRLIDEMWGEEPPANAEQIVRTYVSRLRKILEPERRRGEEARLLVTAPGGYRLTLGEDDVDVLHFEQLVEVGESTGDTGPLLEALRLWRDEPLSEFPYGDFAVRLRERLELRRLDALEARLDLEARSSASGAVVDELRQLVAEHPLRERLWSLLIAGLYRAGQQTEALRTIERCRRELAEVGLEPGPELQDLEEAILQHDDALLASRTPGNLPAEIDRFVGRAEELTQLVELLANARLVTLTGAGGSGKTRLALRAAAQAAHAFPDGVWLVELSHLRAPDLVAPAVAETLGTRVHAPGAAVDVLRESLRRKTLLVVLDNFEHVIDCAPFVTELVEAIAGLTALVTSRERLRVSGETVYRVPPLSTPATDERVTVASLQQSDATALFVERARAVRPDLVVSDEAAEDIAAMCRSLDGLPLPIELATAWVAVVPPAELRDRLGSRLATLSVGSRDRPTRQQTLRGTIDWSYELLEPEEQTLLARLGVFVGGWSVEAAEAVCGPGIALDVMRGLASLSDKSLLRSGPGPDGRVRFTMLETIREYALEALSQVGEADAISRRHCQYFAALCERAEPNLYGPDAERWIAGLEAELGNLRAALTWSFTDGEPELGARLIAALHGFWLGNARLDVDTWARAALRHQDSLDAPVRARLNLALGRVAFGRGQMATAIEILTDALELFELLDDKDNTVSAMGTISICYICDDDAYDHAMGLARRGLAIAREIGNKLEAGRALMAIGELARAHGDVEVSGPAYEESLILAREVGSQRLEAMQLANLSYLADRSGDHHRAGRLATEALMIAVETAQLVTIWCMEPLAGPAAGTGRLDRAARLLGATGRGYKELGFPRQAADQLEYDRVLATLAQAMPPAQLESLMAEGDAMTLDQAVGYALHGLTDPTHIEDAGKERTHT